ncbi:MAG: biotin-dependent carboxyltransferase family protein, partial [Gemmataceae bacterium]|nr:biotin-dependent carboxyltransferase family protein [Gemmataceae bacterium]
MSLRVRETGLLSLLVDFGRPRSRSRGVPLGGAADRFALALGNGLVGNLPDALALEVTLSGPTLETLHPAPCVIYGAPFESTVNNAPVTPGSTFTLEPGDVLRVGGTPTGVRAYVCVAGGFDSPEVLGSRSALEPVRAGGVLACAASRTESRGLGLPPSLVALQGVGRKATKEGGGLRVLDGPQREWFTDGAFFTQTYHVAPASNRMGLRLTGEPLMRRPGELVSEAVAPGAVQVANDGLPIVLGVDGQTIGGYPKVAHVIRADLDLLARLRPGDPVHFVSVTPDQAEE